MADAAPARLNDLLHDSGLDPLDSEALSKFDSYLSLFVRWNSQLNLSSVRDQEAIMERHLIESIAVVHSLPPGIRTLLDYGSGGGLPGIPIALCRPQIIVTLAESQNKKAAFLQEAVRVLGISARVHADRAEALQSVFDCVILRAVDKMPQAVRAAIKLVAVSGWLALMTTTAAFPELQAAAGPHFQWDHPLPLPLSDSRVLVLGRRLSSPA
jgi:16S rRNA (guanine527-N7)-methyltransferase